MGALLTGILIELDLCTTDVCNGVVPFPTAFFRFPAQAASRLMGIAGGRGKAIIGVECGHQQVRALNGINWWGSIRALHTSLNKTPAAFRPPVLWLTNFAIQILRRRTMLRTNNRMTEPSNETAMALRLRSPLMMLPPPM